MSDTLSIQPVTAATALTSVGATSRTSAGASSDTVATAKTVLPDLPNPSMHLDPQLGVVVLQFRNTSGVVTNTLPTAAQLDAYRAFGVPHPGETKSDHLA
ncbi:MAG: hypothetical protein ACRYHQ_41890 [Janthinobacterium lividum]